MKTLDRPALPECTEKRLPRYLRVLKNLMDSGEYRVSSSRLASLLDASPSQIRQDLSCLGEFGLRGYGYDAGTLYTAILDLTGVREEYSAVIFGTPEMTAMLKLRPVFVGQGVALRGCVDSTEKDAKKKFESLCKKERPNITVIASDEKYADVICKIAEQNGVRGIWNLSGARLRTSLPVKNLWIDDSLTTLCYRLGKEEKEKKNGKRK